MKRTGMLLATFLVFICINAQEEEVLKDGYHVFRYPNGTISSEGLLKNGKPEGYWKSYYITGVKKSEGKRSNFMLDSIWVFYDQAGDTTEKISYLYGKKNGYYLKYKKDIREGVYLWSKELFAGDRKEGTAYIYYPDGKIKQTISYIGGRKEGLSREYDRNGIIVSLLEFNNDFLIEREKINRTDDNGLKQGTWKDFYPGGGIRSEKTYKDNMLHGYYKEYDFKGSLVLSMLYDNGSMVKSRIEEERDIEIVNKYNENNKLIYSGPFRNGTPVGIHRQYSNEGKVINAFIYNDNGLLLSEGIVDEAGNRNGKWKDLNPEGNVIAEGTYVSNRKTGPWKFYNSSGTIEQTGSFNNDRPDGLWQWYYPDGSILREEDYFQGKRDGLCVEYSENGDIISQGQYSDDERNGEWKFKTDDFTEEGKYITGMKDGQWRAYYLNGKLKYKANFVQGNPDGTHVFFYESGKVKEERYYRMGIKQRTWKKFDDNGNPVLTITYKDDIEVNINGIKINLPESDIKLIK
jgi:antitoxin component YwqK of YwqJK toxin-antitoxin module